MSKKNYSENINKIMQSIHKSPITMIAVNIDGGIKNYLTLKKIPASTASFLRLLRSQKNKKCAVSFINRNKKFTLPMLYKEIKENVKALQYSKSHKLKPGVNIPGNKKYYTLKTKLAKELNKTY